MSDSTQQVIRTALAEATANRIAALLLTVPGWVGNYTASIDAATWMVDEAKRLGWEITVIERAFR